MANFELSDDQLEAAAALYEWAECKNKPSDYFESTDPQSYFAMAALESCQVCTVRKECLIVMAPAKMYFDGICGGKMFIHGKEIRRK
jgi:hypothetical protein